MPAHTTNPRRKPHRRSKKPRDTQALTNKHHILAALDACGASIENMMAETDYPRSYITSLRSSPLYKLQVEKIRDNILASTTDAAARLLDAETLATVRRIVSLRDNEDGETPHPVQLGAANSIMDRTLPKRHTLDVSATHKVTFDNDTTAMILNAMSEVGFKPAAIDVTPQVANALTVSPEADEKPNPRHQRRDLHDAVGFRKMAESLLEKQEADDSR